MTYVMGANLQSVFEWFQMRVQGFKRDACKEYGRNTTRAVASSLRA